MRGACLLILLLSLAGCATHPGNAAFSLRTNPSPWGEEAVVRGVVNGLHAHNPEKMAELMAKYDEHLSPEEVAALSNRYVVKVGIDREPLLAALMVPVVTSQWASYVVLPEGWTHALSEVSADPNVVNVGDVVEIRVQGGRMFDYLTGVVRECYDEPLADEDRDWNIGCKTYEEFDSGGFAGPLYLIRTF